MSSFADVGLRRREIRGDTGRYGEIWVYTGGALGEERDVLERSELDLEDTAWLGVRVMGLGLGFGLGFRVRVRVRVGLRVGVRC